jgi:hypothetical protein
MNNKWSLISIVLLFLCFTTDLSAQKTEISIGLSEQFFDTVIDTLFQSDTPLEFAIADKALGAESCRESIRLQKDIGGVRTAVRFRDGKIIAPLAFNGSYNPPFIGCVNFAGWAETAIDLEFDEANQRLVARARVLNVNLNGTGGVGGSVIAKMVQSSIDRKINPIEIIKLEKISFMLPVQNSANIKMRAVGVRHELQNGSLNVFISYEFSKI